MAEASWKIFSFSATSFQEASKCFKLFQLSSYIVYLTSIMESKYNNDHIQHPRSSILSRCKVVGEIRPQDLPNLNCVRSAPQKGLVEVLDSPTRQPACPFAQAIRQTSPFGTGPRGNRITPKVIGLKTVELTNKSATPFFNADKRLKQTPKNNLGVLRTVLNILSERNFEKCWSRTNTWVAEEVTGDAQEISAIVNMLFEKAIFDIFICYLHVKFIQKLSNALLPKTMRASMKDVAKQLAINCQRSFLGKCDENSRKSEVHQIDIEKYSQILKEKQEELRRDPKDESLRTTVDVYKNLLREARYVKECAHSKREKGITVLLGHLFLAGLIKEGLVVENMCSLIKRRTDLSMDCLSELLSVVGQYMENNLVGANGGQKAYYNSIFAKIKKISDSAPSGGITFRGKFTALRILEKHHGKCRKVDVSNLKAPVDTSHDEAITNNRIPPAILVSHKKSHNASNGLLSKFASKNRTSFEISNITLRPPTADASQICLRPHTASCNKGPRSKELSSSDEKSQNFGQPPPPTSKLPRAPALPLQTPKEQPSLDQMRRSVSSLIHEISEGYAQLDDVSYDVIKLKKEVQRMHWVEVFLEQICRERRKLDLYGNILGKLVVEAKVISPEILHRGARNYTVRMDDDYADHPHLYSQAAEVFRALLDCDAFPRESLHKAFMNIPGESKLKDLIGN